MNLSYFLFSLFLFTVLIVQIVYCFDDQLVGNANLQIRIQNDDGLIRLVKRTGGTQGVTTIGSPKHSSGNQSPRHTVHTPSTPTFIGKAEETVRHQSPPRNAKVLSGGESKFYSGPPLNQLDRPKPAAHDTLKTQGHQSPPRVPKIISEGGSERYSGPPLNQLDLPNPAHAAIKAEMVQSPLHGGTLIPAKKGTRNEGSPLDSTSPGKDVSNKPASYIHASH